MTGEAKPKWVTVLHGFWLIFALPAQSTSAKVCKFFVVVKAVFFILDVAVPFAGAAYLSGEHWTRMVDSLGEALVWYLALVFVRERDHARAELRKVRA